MSLALSLLLRGVAGAVVTGGGSISGGADVTVNEVRDDSRLVQPGDLFVAAPGPVLDGRKFIADAAKRGASVVVTEGAAPVGFAGVLVMVPNARLALGLIAANRFGAASALTLHAITGTNGKTTTTYLVEGMLAAAGRVPGVIGTVAYRSAAPGFAPIEATNTTPGALKIQSVFAGMRAAGTTDVVLEATSQALAQGRLEGCTFRVAALTNVTQDHLDFHGTMESYFDAKAILFERMLDPVRGVGVLFVDKEEGRRMRARCSRNAAIFGVACRTGVPGADIVVEHVNMDAAGIRATFATPAGRLNVASPLVGEFNLENLAIAVGMGVAAGLPLDSIASGLSGAVGAPGRLERVPNDRGVLCVVDYAHTPDALERAIAAVRPYVRGKLIAVFGCGGDRDTSKRPLMGRIASGGADLAIVTSDNPRTEDPDAIIDMIVPGLEAGQGRWRRERDRRAAIAYAVESAEEGDVVLIAGKGHEDYQILGTTKIHFDDREEAAAAFSRATKTKADA
jgi:UDP-N-acetylmuramoyl-L-alanyl-D-glutamate--2,6-diaminopimelate ligase